MTFKEGKPDNNEDENKSSLDTFHRPHNNRPGLIRRAPERPLSFSLLFLCLTVAAAVLAIPPPALAGSPTPEQEMQTRTMTVDLVAGRSISDSQFQTFAAVMAQIKTAHQALTE